MADEPTIDPVQDALARVEYLETLVADQDRRIRRLERDAGLLRWAPVKYPGASAEAKIYPYLNPKQAGVEPNQEARLFLAAVQEGFVPATAAGLETVLGYLSKGAAERPADIQAFFTQFYAAERGESK